MQAITLFVSKGFIIEIGNTDKNNSECVKDILQVKLD